MGKVEFGIHCYLTADTLTKVLQKCPLSVCVCVFWFNVVLKKKFSHITTVSGCDRELNAHFYSVASLKYHVPDT